MLYTAKIEVVLRPSILDPQGKATQHALHSLGFAGVERVRMGKLVEMLIEASSADEARKVADSACQKVLANPVMEDYSIEIEETIQETA